MFARRDLLLLTPLLLVAVSLAQPGEFGARGQKDTVSVTELQPNRVIGMLGQPLGSVVRVTGTSVDGVETGNKADSAQTLLKIQTVNGKPLANPVYFHFNRAAEGIHEPKVGQSFDYFVHEWGAFDGHVELPKEVGVETLPIAHDGFWFRKEITIHKSNERDR
jgi:hypothetical protein